MPISADPVATSSVRAADALALALLDDGNAAQLYFVLGIGLDQLKMRDDLTVVRSDEDTPLIKVSLQPLRRVLRECEQTAQPRPLCRMPGDLHGLDRRGD